MPDGVNEANLAFRKFKSSLTSWDLFRLAIPVSRTMLSNYNRKRKTTQQSPFLLVVGEGDSCNLNLCFKKSQIRCSPSWFVFENQSLIFEVLIKAAFCVVLNQLPK